MFFLAFLKLICQFSILINKALNLGSSLLFSHHAAPSFLVDLSVEFFYLLLVELGLASLFKE
jgi:hypothetical protein